MASGTNKGKGIGQTLPEQLPVSFLREITDNFSKDRILSTSIFGTVYKGIIDERDTIAVKRLDDPTVPFDKFFTSEVSNLKALKHENIVELRNFCLHTEKTLKEHNGRFVIVDASEYFLCYEYLPNGSLDGYLYGELMKIEWETRFQIIKGICQGLHFLHEQPDGPLIHMNLQPSSIWLNENWVPKIADFGLSRIFGQEKSGGNTQNVIGKNGYMAPEYLYKGEISTKSDIYALGMLIIEITTGDSVNANSEDRSARKFVDKVHQFWTSEDKIAQKYTSLDAYSIQQVKSCIVIGLKCVEVDRKKRPSIVDIVNKLDGKQIPIFDEDM